MDGKMKILEIQPQNENDNIQIKHQVETSNGVMCSEYFNFVDNTQNKSQEFIVLGMEDGSLNVYDYTKFGN